LTDIGLVGLTGFGTVFFNGFWISD